MKQLLQRALNGDELAFNEMTRPTLPKLYAMAYQYVHNQQDAVDVVQESLLNSYHALSQLKQAEFFSTWLTKIVIRNSFRLLENSTKAHTFENDLILPFTNFQAPRSLFI